MTNNCILRAYVLKPSTRLRLANCSLSWWQPVRTIRVPISYNNQWNDPHYKEKDLSNPAGKQFYSLFSISYKMQLETLRTESTKPSLHILSPHSAHNVALGFISPVMLGCSNIYVDWHLHFLITQRSNTANDPCHGKECWNWLLTQAMFLRRS